MQELPPEQEKLLGSVVGLTIKVFVPPNIHHARLTGASLAVLRVEALIAGYQLLNHCHFAGEASYYMFEVDCVNLDRSGKTISMAGHEFLELVGRFGRWNF